MTPFLGIVPLILALIYCRSIAWITEMPSLSLNLALIFAFPLVWSNVLTSMTYIINVSLSLSSEEQIRLIELRDNSFAAIELCCIYILKFKRIKKVRKESEFKHSKD